MRRAPVITLAAAGIFLAALPARAGQPISESLVECGEIFALAARIGREDGRPPEKIAMFERAVGLFGEEARRQIMREGVSDPNAALATLRARKHRKWDGRFDNFFALSDNLDWIQYCVSLGKSRGLRFREN